MENLILNTDDQHELQSTLNELELEYGNNYGYKPSNSFASCTCQGNCDGPTGASTCQWG